MAYSTNTPPDLVSQTLTHREWVYHSTDAATVVRVAGYFTNGWDLGMRVGDAVKMVNATTGATHNFVVNAASAAGGVDVIDGLAVTMTDTD